MTDSFPNQVRAYDRLDEFDDVLHYIYEFPATIPASEIRPISDGEDYVWEDHMDINPTTGEVSVDRLPNMERRPDDGIAHVFPFVVAATDGLNVTLQEVTFRVKHTIEKPIWGTRVVDFTRVEGSEFSAPFVAFDPERGSLVYTVSGLPGFTMSADGILTGTVPANATQIVRDFPFTVSARSATSGEISDLPCVLHVTNNNRAPEWTSSSVFSVSPGPWSTTLSAVEIPDTENDGPAKFEIISEPNGFMLNGSTLSRVNADQTADHFVTVRAYTGEGNRRLGTDQIITVKVTEIPNDPPVWVTQSGSIGGGEGGSSFNYQLRATDTELVTYSVTSGALPSGLSMSETGNITGTLPNVAQGTSQFAFTVTASDGENFVPRSFAISVSRANTPPEWRTPAGLLLDVWAGQPIDLQLSAPDPEGAAITYAISKPSSLGWLNMSQTGRITGTVPTIAEATTSNIVFTVNATDGVHVVQREFQVRIKRLAPQTISFKTSNNWIVSEGCYSIMFPWVIAGGGGGGAGHQYGNGGGGGGGGSGGYVRHVEMPVTPGDVLEITVGDGGAGSTGGQGDRVVGTGAHGGNTTVRNGTKWVISTQGGRGGAVNTNWGSGYIVAPGGEGGSPNGIKGTDGPAGSNDSMSVGGGEGARGHTINSNGGPGGTAGGGADTVSGPSVGKPGTGYGSGGGGGGSSDRSGGDYWRGGTGAPGFVEFTFPSLGVITDPNHQHYGTPPWTASTVDTSSNYIAFFGPAAGSDMQDNYYTNQPNLSYNVGSGRGQISSTVVFGVGVWEVFTGNNYTGTKITVDGSNQEFHIGSFRGISRVGSARRAG